MTKEVERIILHKGIYKKTATTAQAVFMITGLTIGAGIFGLPYAVAQVGIPIGIFYIVILGLLMLFLNLMIGEIATRTKEPLQLPGLAGKYLGGWAKKILTITIVGSSYGALLAYTVGEGRILQQFFGGSNFVWSCLFWLVGSYIIWRGLDMAKNVQKILSLIVLLLLVGIAFYLIPHGKLIHWNYTNFNNLFFPYGVILFSLYGAPAIAEAHALLPGSQKKFRRALIIGSLIPIGVYTLFVLAIVGNTGHFTTELALEGLKSKFGVGILIIGNLCALLSMGSGFVGLGLALKQVFTWDYKIKPVIAQVLVVSIPLLLFLLGLRSFILILDVVGGVFIGIQSILMVLTYWKTKHVGILERANHNLHHIWLFIVPVMAVFIFATVYSVIQTLEKVLKY